MGSSRSDNPHFDRGDGVCADCFVDFPCDGSKGAVWSGIHEFEQQEQIDRMARIRSEKDRKIEEINERLEELGFNFRHSEWSETITLRIDDMLSLVRKIPEISRSQT